MHTFISNMTASTEGLKFYTINKKNVSSLFSSNQ